MLSRIDTRLRIGAACLVTATLAVAQEGYPLDGTWRGNWGDEATSNHVVIVMKWDGERINGTINPGPRSVAFTAATLAPSKWTVHFEAVSREGDPIAIDGELTDIGSYNRSIVGTWTHAGTSYPFKITRE